jgi:hypothetical protein
VENINVTSLDLFPLAVIVLEESQIGRGKSVWLRKSDWSRKVRLYEKLDRRGKSDCARKARLNEESQIGRGKLDCERKVRRGERKVRTDKQSQIVRGSQTALGKRY